MNSFDAIKLTISCLLLFATTISGVRIAIIGAGIGGCSSAYFLREFLEKTNVPPIIDVYERNDYIGGRLKHADIGGATLNLGGDAWSSVNHYLVQLQKQLNIPLDNFNTSGGNGLVGLYAGSGNWEKPVIDEHSIERISAIQLTFVNRLNRNYGIRGESGTFSSMVEFLETGNLTVYSATSTYNFIESNGVAPAFANSTLWPLTRVIYDQNLTLSAFAGIVSMLSVDTPAYSALGGNDQVVKTLCSNASVHLNSPIDTVTVLANNKVEVHIQSTDTSNVYDAVVLAAPIEFANVDFRGISISVANRTFVHWYVTLVEASGLNPAYFGCKPVPDTIFTTGDSTAPFVIIALQAVNNENMKIYKIFSNEDVSPLLNQIFDNYLNSVVQHWPYTFPDLNPQASSNATSFQPVTLSENIYYLNTIESVVTAMEGSVIAGRNAALLISNKQ